MAGNPAWVKNVGRCDWPHCGCAWSERCADKRLAEDTRTLDKETEIYALPPGGFLFIAAFLGLAALVAGFFWYIFHAT